MLARARILARAGRAREALQLGGRALSLAKEMVERPHRSADELSALVDGLIMAGPERLRDPRTAVVYAERAVQRARYPDLPLLRSLALAYDANHRDQAAAEAMRRALDLLPYPIRRRDDAGVWAHIRRAFSSALALASAFRTSQTARA